MKSRMEIMKELLFLAKTTLQPEGEMGYTMPDGKHHIYIYGDEEPHWDGNQPEKFYVVEPNAVVDGAHEPIASPYLTNTQDLSEVLLGCQWCMEVFDEAREKAVQMENGNEQLPDELIVRLAHEAGWMEAEGKIEMHSWEDLQIAIRDAIEEYYENPNERNPFSIEETIEKILLDRFPSDPEPAMEQTSPELKKPSLSVRIQESDTKRKAADKAKEKLYSEPELSV